MCIHVQVFDKILSDTAIENRKEYKEVVDFVRWVVREYFKLALEVIIVLWYVMYVYVCIYLCTHVCWFRAMGRSRVLQAGPRGDHCAVQM